MTYETPTEDLRGTEPARQTDDPTLSDSEGAAPLGPTTAADDSRPGMRIGLVLLAGFLGLLAVAIVWALAIG